jgi:hypothetical protein
MYLHVKICVDTFLSMQNCDSYFETDVVLVCVTYRYRYAADQEHGDVTLF